jgi:hypothetical protein
MATPEPVVDPNAATQDVQPPQMPQKWIAALLPLLAEGDPETAEEILRGCSASHYDDLNMQKTTDRFRGNLDSFLEFLGDQWGWILDYDGDTGVISVNENKDDCVCPLVHKTQRENLGILCHCSAGFAERMFSAVIGSPVHAEVTESILRGGKRCRYRIELRPRQG